MSGVLGYLQGDQSYVCLQDPLWISNISHHPSRHQQPPCPQCWPRTKVAIAFSISSMDNLVVGVIWDKITLAKVVDTAQRSYRETHSLAIDNVRKKKKGKHYRDQT